MNKHSTTKVTHKKWLVPCKRWSRQFGSRNPKWHLIALHEWKTNRSGIVTDAVELIENRFIAVRNVIEPLTFIVVVIWIFWQFPKSCIENWKYDHDNDDYGPNADAVLAKNTKKKIENYFASDDFTTTVGLQPK